VKRGAVGTGSSASTQCFLKTFAVRADGTSVADANLFPDEAGFTPRPAWQVIEAARRRYLTGELTLPTTPPTRVFLRDGMVYFAERTSDGALPIRLMVEGVITREQMQRGTVIVNGIEHVGRLFEADPAIDRASVELCVELFTDDVMIAVANTTVNSYELALYRRHPSGIDRWYPHTVPVTGRPSETSANETSTTREPAETPTSAAPKAVAKPRPKAEPATPSHAPARAAEAPAPAETTAEPVPAEVKAEAAPAEVKAEPVPAEVKAEAAPAEVKAEAAPAEVKAEAAPAEPKAEPKNKLNAPPITQAVPVTAAAASTTVPPPPPITQVVPTISSITTQLPVVSAMPAPTAQIPVTSPANGEVDAAVIADEVAEAIKRAFAGMGAGL
jgi:hypothetical protein